LKITARTPVVIEIMSRRVEEEGDAGILGEIAAGKVAGGVGVVDGEDLRLSTTGGSR
jgi:hypothetical protein